MTGFRALITTIVGVALPLGTAASSLYTDQRAYQIDDIVTILVVESSSASQRSETEASKDASFATNVGPGQGGLLDYIPLLNVSGSADNNFQGTGATSRSGSISSTLTARVIEVSPNGNLIVEGSRTVVINQEEEIVEVRGVVRPRDIRSDNTVFSTSLADAHVSYRGSGALSTSSRQGVVSRVLGWLF